MKGNERDIVRALVAVAWADGKVAEPEEGIIASLLWAFDATAAEEEEIVTFAKVRRKLADSLSVANLTRTDKELLFAHAALMTHADGSQTPDEAALLADLAGRLEITAAEAAAIVEQARVRAARFASRL